MSSFTEQTVEGVSPVTTEVTSQAVTNNQDNPFLKVGDRVFTTQEDAIKHINSAQEHIQKLEKDWGDATTLLDRQSDLLEKASRVDELMNAVEQKATTQEPTTQVIDKGAIIAEAVNALEQRQKEASIQEQRKANWKTVGSTLSSLYGDKTDEVVQKVIDEHGMSMDEATQMAASLPKVFLKMFDKGPASSSVIPNSSSVRTEAVANTPASGKRIPLMKMTTKQRANYIKQRMAELA